MSEDMHPVSDAPIRVPSVCVCFLCLATHWAELSTKGFFFTWGKEGVANSGIKTWLLGRQMPTAGRNTRPSPGFFKQHFAKRPHIAPLRRGLDKWRVGRVKYQLEDEESEPLRGSDPNVHNSAGALVSGQLPLITPGMEGRTIVVQMTFGCCCSEFDAFYLPKKTALTRDEFDGALVALNKTLRRPPLWSYIFAPCCFVACCWRDRALHRTLDALNLQYGGRGVAFSTSTRLHEGPQADNLIGRELNHKLGTFLVIEQHEPADAEQMTATCTSNGASSSDCEVGSFAPVVPST